MEEHQKTKQETLYFPNGLFGLEEFKEYTLLSDEQDLPIKWLQSVDEPSVALVVINPYQFFNEYAFQLSDEIFSQLDTNEVSDILVMNVVVIPQNLEKMTVNLVAPVLVNVHNRRGVQTILTDTNYQVRQPLYEAFQRVLAEEAK